MYDTEIRVVLINLPKIKSIYVNIIIKVKKYYQILLQINQLMLI